LQAAVKLASRVKKRGGAFRILICFLEGGNWKMGDEMMGYGIWDMGYGVGAATVSWIIQPGGRISYIQSSISDAFVEGTKKGGVSCIYMFFRR
jgi:hypothetical protein